MRFCRPRKPETGEARLLSHGAAQPWPTRPRAPDVDELMSAVDLRILDANLNRAQEALRVLEDEARFAHDDRAAAGDLKQMRHALRALRTGLGDAALLAARDARHDVGRDLKTSTEYDRAQPGDVAAAAFGRLREALRSLEEFTKPRDAALARQAEALRYRAYEIEPRLRLRATRLPAFRAARLYVLISAELCRGDWLRTAEAALRGGARCLQLREKGLSDAEWLRRARQLRDLTRRYDAWLFINDRPDIARLADADGVHLGQDDLSVADARRILSGAQWIGKSTHTAAQLATAIDERPDYLALGPMYPTTTKPQEHIAGVELLAAVAPDCPLPLVAIGGINARNAAPVHAAGATLLCVCSAILTAEDPEAATRALLASIETIQVGGATAGARPQETPAAPCVAVDRPTHSQEAR